MAAKGTEGSIFTNDSATRKTYPMFRGLLNYFPDALAAVARVSYLGNEQHHPNTDLHWDKAKSTDEEDALIRHLIEGDYDKMAWRALAALQRKLDAQTKSEPTLRCTVCAHRDDCTRQIVCKASGNKEYQPQDCSSCGWCDGDVCTHPTPLKCLTTYGDDGKPMTSTLWKPDNERN